MQTQKEFLQLVQQNKGIILKLVGLYVNNKEDEKDLYQEVLFQTWKAWPSFRQESKFSTWLYRISLNTILTHKRKVNKLAFTDRIEDYASTVPHRSDMIEDSQQLNQAIRQLPETDRAIITLHLDGYTNPEIADIIGISNNNTGVKLYRIKNQLTQYLNPSHGKS